MLTAKIDCIVLANPTDSDVRHTQMVCTLLDMNLRMQVGRATRLSPKTGKVDCLVIDLVGNCDRFPLGVGPSLKSEFMSTCDDDEMTLTSCRKKEGRREGE